MTYHDLSPASQTQINPFKDEVLFFTHPSVWAALVFVVGNAFAFALEALVAGIQALRLEYYELFSRVFSGQGRLFEPWHVPMATEE